MSHPRDRIAGMAMNKKERADLEAARRAAQVAKHRVNAALVAPVPMTAEQINQHNIQGRVHFWGVTNSKHLEYGKVEPCTIAGGTIWTLKHLDPRVQRPGSGSRLSGYTGSYVFLTEADARLFFYVQQAESAAEKLADHYAKLDMAIAEPSPALPLD